MVETGEEEAPNPKLQPPKKSQAPNFKAGELEGLEAAVCPGGLRVANRMRVSAAATKRERGMGMAEAMEPWARRR